jgi:hypothetical protein
MKWFKHDSDANMDGKLQEVLLDYGLEGYGLYWYCIEMITSKVSKDNLTFELEHDSRIIARNTGSSVQRVQEMMTRFIDLGLFDNANGNIRCLKLLKRLDSSMTNNKEMRQLIQSAKVNHDIVMTQSDNVMLEEKRIDKNRLDKKENKVFKKPTVDEIVSYMTERQWTNPEARANEWLDHYLSNGFKIGKAKTPMKDWKAAVRTWERDGKHRKPDHSNIPIAEIANEYKRLLSQHTGYYPELINDKMRSDIARIWNGDTQAQNISWWVGFFSTIKNKIQDTPPQFMPKMYKFDRLVGFDFDNVINELR